MNSVKINDIECNLLKSTAGNSGLDISEILKQNKSKFFDPGFAMTASCESKITYINGEQGLLAHRGYDIQDITANKTFLETMYLILKGDFPNQSELQNLIDIFNNIKVETELFQKIVSNIPKNSHPMSVLMTLSASFTALKSTKSKIEDSFVKSIDMIKNLLAMVCFTFRHHSGQEFQDLHKGDFDYTKYFISNAGINISEYGQSGIECLDKILTLHIDHGQNASTSTTRMIASSECNLYGSVTGAIASLWGFLHGGANEAVLSMLENIGSVENVDKFFQDVKDKKAKLMGFGHRVYKNYDPRAAALKKYAHNIISSDKKNSALLKIADLIEQKALNDEYFVSRKLFPNVDFYSGLVYKSFGIHKDLFTCIFAVSRVVGWCAHFDEANSQGIKIWRPGQVYTGETGKKI